MHNRLKQLRKEKGLTLDEIQNQTGIKRGTFNNLLIFLNLVLYAPKIKKSVHPK